MTVKKFRTYHRRSVTRRSGYHVSGLKTGGECIILPSAKYITTQSPTIFHFYRKNCVFTELFERQMGLLAFGGYIYSSEPVSLLCKLSYTHRDETVNEENVYSHEPKKGVWNPIGFHKEFALSAAQDFEIRDVSVNMKISAPVGTTLFFTGFDFGTVTSRYYQSAGEDTIAEDGNQAGKFWFFFHQKTSLCIPYLYYFDATLPFETYLVNHGEDLEEGIPVVFKGCNRCSRYLPIQMENELQTMAFALHCKKRAPCTHPTFSRYRIDNHDELSPDTVRYYRELGCYQTENDQPIIRSRYGHQLECKACKKYFVNAKLNPMRNPQQRREDGLRRRAIEALVDNLLDEDFIHFTFRKQHKKEFTDYIWNKFHRRCFKCQKQISKQEMALDHTMPLAFLYRLDETATCLCSTHNSPKSDHFPVDYYSEEELERLSGITGIPLDILHSKKANGKVIRLLRKHVVWFFDDFLSQPDYQKIHDGKLEADKIYAAIVRVIDTDIDFKDIDLIEEYRQIRHQYPTTITIC